MDLICHMFKPTPDQRLSMADIVNHPWLQGEIASAEDIKKEFAKRKAEIAEKQAELKAKQAELFAKQAELKKNNKSNRIIVPFVGYAFDKGKTMSDEKIEESKTEQPQTARKLGTYYAAITKYTQIFSPNEPKQIFA